MWCIVIIRFISYILRNVKIRNRLLTAGRKKNSESGVKSSMAIRRRGVRTLGIPGKNIRFAIGMLAVWLAGCVAQLYTTAIGTAIMTIADLRSASQLSRRKTEEETSRANSLNFLKLITSSNYSFKLIRIERNCFIDGTIFVQSHLLIKANDKPEMLVQCNKYGYVHPSSTKVT